MTLFHCLVKWIEAQEEQNENLIRQVFSYVRFPMMSPRQLADLLLCSLTQRYKEFFVERMAVSMAFHSGLDWRKNLFRFFNHLWNNRFLLGQKEHFTEALLVNNNPDSLLFTPRLYTAEKWSAHLTLENFPSLPAYHTRTLLLSSPVSCADYESDSYEWVIEFSPKGMSQSLSLTKNVYIWFEFDFKILKFVNITLDYVGVGVWFRACCLIVWQGNIEVPETVLRTVRLSLTLKVNKITFTPKMFNFRNELII